MQDMLTESNWDLILRRIKNKECTPFLGAGACHPPLPLASDIAEELAAKYDYPLDDCHDLARVAQFLAVENDWPFAQKQVFEKLFEKDNPPNLTPPNEPHSVLASLPIKLYLTTNYDDFMMRALKDHGKTPARVICGWKKAIKNEQCCFPKDDPTHERPVVFHLHGCKDVPESIVLTEDDYLEFLVNVSENRDMLPPVIQSALKNTSLLFIGYGLRDINFRVLFRGLVATAAVSDRRISVTVQTPPKSSHVSQEEENVKKYLTRYYDKFDIRVFWGKADEFAGELAERWKEFPGAT